MKQSRNSYKQSEFSQISSPFDVESRLKSNNLLDQSKSLAKPSSIDLKKLNLNKNPAQSTTSLQLLILVLHKSLKLSLEQILGLFTNHNKYLAHIIVKGLKDEFKAIRQFYQLMNDNVSTLKRLYEEDTQDAMACLYAIKPGFISKDQKCAKLTIELFENFGKEIYVWFVGKESKCSQTLLLGIKRHEKLTQKFVGLLFDIIKDNEIEYFKIHYSTSFTTQIESLNITGKLIRNLANESNTKIVDSLEQNDVFQQWFQTAQKVYEQGTLDSQLIVIDFIGDCMKWLPSIIQERQNVIGLLRRNWPKMQMIQFIPLFNLMLIKLQHLALSESSMSKQMYKVIIDIFTTTYEQEDKRQFIIQGVFSILSQFPTIPSDSFITNYRSGHYVGPSDFLLFCEAIDISENAMGLIRIANTLKEMFLFDVIGNSCLARVIVEVVKKIMNFEGKETIEFMNVLIKIMLSSYVNFLNKAKSQQKNISNPDDKLLNKKKSLQRAFQQQNDATLLKKRADFTIELCQKVIEIILSSPIEQTYHSMIKNYLLNTNSEIKKSNYGKGSKKLLNILQKRFKITKQQQQAFDQESKQIHNLSKSGIKVSESLLSKKARQSIGAISSLSRVQVPDKLTRGFEEIVAKRKREQQIKIEDQSRRKKQEEFKLILHKKELEKMNLIKGGFGQGEAQLKEEGFWSRFLKQTQEFKIFTSQQIQDVHLQSAQLIVKKYQKLFKYFFSNYSNTMYSTRTSNFDQNSQRKELLSSVEILKFLKDYALIFTTNLSQVQTLIKEINQKIFYRKEVLSELDYEGFQEFVKQFCLCVWSRGQKFTSNPQQVTLKLQHFTLPQLLMNLIDYLRNVFKVKGESLAVFEVAESHLLNPSTEVQKINQKLKKNPNYILPEGYKKIVDKKIQFNPHIKQNFTIDDSHVATLQVLDEIVFENLGFHLIEPHAVKVVKFTAKPFHQLNAGQRDLTKIKARAVSTFLERKSSSHSSLDVITKSDLSKGFRLGKPQDRFSSDRLAYRQEILRKSSNEQNNAQLTLNKLRNIQKLGDNPRQRNSSHRRAQSLQKIIPSDKIDVKPFSQGRFVQNVQRQIMRKRQQKLQEERKQEEQAQLKRIRKKQQQERYHYEQKQKIEEKKRIEQPEETKRKLLQQAKQQQKLKKEKFEEFNTKQVEKYKNMFEEMIEKKKKIEQEKQYKYQEQQQNIRRIKSKIDSQDKIIVQLRKETAQAINDILFGQAFNSLAKEYEVPLRTIFQYLEKHYSNPLSQKKPQNGEIDLETWKKFNNIFEISPLIVSPKDTINIFKAVNKDKRIPKQYSTGLNYQEFLHCLLRQCIKQKTVFGKIAEKIKEEKVYGKGDDKKWKKNQSFGKKVELRNEFTEDEETDVKKLLKQPDVRDDIIDHYGDVSTFSIDSFKGLVYYLRMPFTKKGQEKRLKELIQIEKKPEGHNVSNLDRLKEKLMAEYTLERGEKKEVTKVQTSKKQNVKEIKGPKFNDIKEQTLNDVKAEKVNSKLIKGELTVQIKQKSDKKPVAILNDKKLYKK